MDSEKHIENDEYLFNIQAIERNTMISYSDTQKQAVYLAQKHGLLIIVGGAGSGKTVTIDLITKYFDELGKKLFMCTHRTSCTAIGRFDRKRSKNDT